MSTHLTTIPNAQDIDGLLRLWSPVVLYGKHAGFKSAVACLDPLSIASSDGAEVVNSVGFDLTHETGRAHAVAWVSFLCLDPAATAGQRLVFRTHFPLIEIGRCFLPVIGSQISTLAHVVLRLAGKTT